MEQSEDTVKTHPSVSSSSSSGHKFVPTSSIKTDPFVNISLEELSLVTDVSFWTNCNVRCIGKLMKKHNEFIFQSCLKPGEVYEIMVDASLMKVEPPLNVVIQIFGEVYVSDRKTPVLKGFFFRNFEGVSLTLYEEALELMRPHVPLFVSPTISKHSLSEESFESESFDLESSCLIRNQSKVFHFQPLKRPLYDNCQLVDMGGNLLSTCSGKKVNWYVKKKLGVVTNTSPLTLQLNFTPKNKNLWRPDYDYYGHNKENICTVCGETEALTRKYIVPAEYRKYLEDVSHSCHDILLVCQLCHERLDEAQSALRKSLCKKLNVPLSQNEILPKLLKNETRERVQKAASTIKKYEFHLPETRKKELEEIIKSFYKVEYLNKKLIDEASEVNYWKENEEYQPHGQLLVETFRKFYSNEKKPLNIFEKVWRLHFLEMFVPKYLPLGWSVDHGHQ